MLSKAGYFKLIGFVSLIAQYCAPHPLVDTLSFLRFQTVFIMVSKYTSSSIDIETWL